MLDQETKQGLVWLSRTRGRSMSEWVRESVADKVKEEKKKQKKMKRVDPVKALLETAKRAEKLAQEYGLGDGPTDLSLNIDHYLYGAPKRK